LSAGGGTSAWRDRGRTAWLRTESWLSVALITAAAAAGAWLGTGDDDSAVRTTGGRGAGPSPRVEAPEGWLDDHMIDNADRDTVCDQLAAIASDERRTEEERSAAAWRLTRVGALPFALESDHPPTQNRLTGQRLQRVLDAWATVRASPRDERLRVRVHLAVEQIDTLAPSPQLAADLAGWIRFHTGRFVPTDLPLAAWRETLDTHPLEEWLLAPTPLVPACTDEGLISLLESPPDVGGRGWNRESLLAVLEVRHGGRRGVPWRIDGRGRTSDLSVGWREALEIAPVAARVVGAWIDFDDGELRAVTRSRVLSATHDDGAFWLRPPLRANWTAPLAARPSFPGAPILDTAARETQRSHPHARVTYSQGEAGVVLQVRHFGGIPRPAAPPATGFFQGFAQTPAAQRAGLGSRVGGSHAQLFTHAARIESGRAHRERISDVCVFDWGTRSRTCLIWAEDPGTAPPSSPRTASEAAVTRAVAQMRADVMRTGILTYTSADDVTRYLDEWPWRPQQGIEAAIRVPHAEAHDDLKWIVERYWYHGEAQRRAVLALALSGEKKLLLDPSEDRWLPKDFRNVAAERRGAAFWLDVLVRTDDADVGRRALAEIDAHGSEPHMDDRILGAANRLALVVPDPDLRAASVAAGDTRPSSLARALTRRPKIQLAMVANIVVLLIGVLLLLRARAGRRRAGSQGGGLLFSAWAIVIGLLFVVGDLWVDLVDLVPDAVGWLLVAGGVRGLARAAPGAAGRIAFSTTLAAAVASAAAQIWREHAWIGTVESTSAIVAVLAFAPLARTLVLGVPDASEPVPRQPARSRPASVLIAFALAAVTAGVTWVAVDAGAAWTVARAPWIAGIALVCFVAAWARLTWHRDGRRPRVGSPLPLLFAAGYGVPCAAMTAYFGVLPWHGTLVWPFVSTEIMWTARIVAAIAAFWCVARLIDAAAYRVSIVRSP